MVWYIADPAHPDVEPAALRYPQAGTPNALVSLALVDLDGERVDVDWRSDHELDGNVLEYLAHVEWSRSGPLLIAADPGPDAAGVPRGRPADGDEHAGPRDDGRRLGRADPRNATAARRRPAPARSRRGRDPTPRARRRTAFTPEGVQVRGVVDADDDGVVAVVSPAPVGAVVAGQARVRRVGHHLSATRTVSRSASPRPGTHGRLAAAARATRTSPPRCMPPRPAVGTLRSVAETPPLVPEPVIRVVGSRAYPSAVIFPTGHVPGLATAARARWTRTAVRRCRRSSGRRVRT